MSVLMKEEFEDIRQAALLVSDGKARRIDGEFWTVYFVPAGDEHGTIRIDIKRGAA